MEAQPCRTDGSISLRLFKIKAEETDIKNILIKLLKNMEWEFILTLFLSNGNWMFNKKEKINKDKEKSRGQEEDNSDEKSTDQKDNMNQEECDNQEQKSMKAIGFRKKGDENEKEEYFYLTGKSDYNIMNFINLNYSRLRRVSD